MSMVMAIWPLAVLGVVVISVAIAARRPEWMFGWAMFTANISILPFDRFGAPLRLRSLGFDPDDNGGTLDQLVTISARRELPAEARILVLAASTVCVLQTDRAGNLRLLSAHPRTSLLPQIVRADVRRGSG